MDYFNFIGNYGEFIKIISIIKRWIINTPNPIVQCIIIVSYPINKYQIKCIGSVNLRDYYAIVVISKQIQPSFYML